LANTDLTQQIRAAVTGWNQRYLEPIYAGSGSVLASLLFEILVDYLLVFAARLCCLEFGGLPASFYFGEIKFLFGLEFVFDANLDYGGLLCKSLVQITLLTIMDYFVRN
jgi:hypothetical protein